jgi:hypothetical protein
LVALFQLAQQRGVRLSIRRNQERQPLKVRDTVLIDDIQPQFKSIQNTQTAL